MCSTCGKSFKVKSNLLRHIRLHSSEGPYTCSICVKAFSQKSYLSNHMKLHQSRVESLDSNCVEISTQKAQPRSADQAGRNQSFGLHPSDDPFVIHIKTEEDM